jgi:hypothetical protein
MSEKSLSLARLFNGPFLGLIIWIIGFAMSGMGGHEFLTSLRCAKQPAQVSVAELAHVGPAGNDYVSLTDFEVAWNGYLCFRDEQGRWQSCDVPLRVAGSAAPPRVLLRVYQPQNEEHLRQLLSGPQLTGIVTGRGLGGDCAATLAAYNPGIDPGACWIVGFNHKPTDPRLMGGVFILGLGLFTLSFLLFAHCRQRSSPEQSVQRAMSPLLMLVEGVHFLADRLPAGSGRICGAIALVPSAAIAIWGGWKFWLASQVSAGEAHMGAEILGIVAVDFGFSLAVVALSFMLAKPRTDDAAEQNAALSYGSAIQA